MLVIDKLRYRSYFKLQNSLKFDFYNGDTYLSTFSRNYSALGYLWDMNLKIHVIVSTNKVKVLKIIMIKNS